MSKPSVAIVMGSDSDWPVMEAAANILKELGIAHDVSVLSAHRMPEEMMAFGKGAVNAGYRVIIAGAGGAAHLPGMLASVTTLPVIGVPVPLKDLDGMDSLLSIVQMPGGIPVATVGIGNAKNAGLLAARILSIADPALEATLSKFAGDLHDEAVAKGASLKARRENKTGF
ncbi:MAG: 5-(carboxyamino)imidazole ribonucleotide mutase [Actinobacteria bacterium]|nr:5-(carboxyamino)imidazole ribonucleotide mutase [Actinomycetota bacterium]